MKKILIKAVPNVVKNVMRMWPILALFGYSTSVFPMNMDQVVGKWTTPEDKSMIEIYKCGSEYCGKIVWLKEPKYETTHVKAGQDKLDDKNPDISQRTRPIVGLKLMHGFRYDGDGVWDDGEIYDPESGKTYSCKMTLENSHTLKVRGYIGFSLIGRTSVWTR